MQPYHTLKESRSLLPTPFKVCGNSDANLSHFEGVEVTFAYVFAYIFACVFVAKTRIPSRPHLGNKKP